MTSYCLTFFSQDLQESEVCQDELALRVKQLKTELVLFKGLVSNVINQTWCVQHCLYSKVPQSSKLFFILSIRICQTWTVRFKRRPWRWTWISAAVSTSRLVSVTSPSRGTARTWFTCSRYVCSGDIRDSSSTSTWSKHASSLQVPTPPSTLSGRTRKTSGQSAKGGDGEELSVSESEGGGTKEEELCSTSANQINEQMQRMLNQL